MNFFLKIVLVRRVITYNEGKILPSNPCSPANLSWKLKLLPGLFFLIFSFSQPVNEYWQVRIQWHFSQKIAFSNKQNWDVVSTEWSRKVSNSEMVTAAKNWTSASEPDSKGDNITHIVILPFHISEKGKNNVACFPQSLCVC